MLPKRRSPHERSEMRAKQPDVASLIRATRAPSLQLRGAQGTTTRSMSAMA